MAVNFKAKPQGSATVSKAIVDGKAKVNISEDTTEEKVAVPDSEGEGQIAGLQAMCEVGVDASFTKNLGNYQSAKVGVSLKVPCPHGDVDDVFEFAKTWVNGKLESIIAEL